MFAFALIIIFLSVNLTIGYVVAPVLFNFLDKTEAGNIVGVLLHYLYWFDLILLVTALSLLWRVKHYIFKRERWLWAALLMIGLNQFWVSPIMIQLKMLGENAQFWGLAFAPWHGISQVIFMFMLLFVFGWMTLFIKAFNKS